MHIYIKVNIKNYLKKKQCLLKVLNKKDEIEMDMDEFGVKKLYILQIYRSDLTF